VTADQLSGAAGADAGSDDGADLAIAVRDVSKVYHIYDRPQHRLWQSLLLGRRQFYREFHALQPLSFDVRRGETVAIIGRNGSGKSTLLKLISGILKPTSGDVRVNGRVAALLTLHSLPAVMLSAAVAGFSMAPIFPVCVSIFMSIARNPAQTRWMFAIAGLGSATLPWATGQLAARTGSLHTGLLVPLMALGLMLVMMRWPGGGTDLFRTVFHPPAERPLPPRGTNVLPTL